MDKETDTKSRNSRIPCRAEIAPHGHIYCLNSINICCGNSSVDMALAMRTWVLIPWAHINPRHSRICLFPRLAEQLSHAEVVSSRCSWRLYLKKWDGEWQRKAQSIDLGIFVHTCMDTHTHAYTQKHEHAFIRDWNIWRWSLLVLDNVRVNGRLWNNKQVFML